jgi:hypothetical protein
MELISKPAVGGKGGGGCGVGSGELPPPFLQELNRNKMQMKLHKYFRVY